MVHLDGNGGARPAGALVDRLSVNGERYELFHAPNVGACYRDGRGSFRRDGNSTAGKLELTPLLDHLVRRGDVSPDHHLASVELGNELMGGLGTTWVVPSFVRDAPL